MTALRRQTTAARRAGRKSGLRAAIAELAQDAAAGRVMSRSDADRITLRMLGPDALPGVETMTGKEIAALREAANMSQAVFAQVLAVSKGTLSKWERGEIAPRDPARRLLQVIKAQGVEAVCKVGN